MNNIFSGINFNKNNNNEDKSATALSQLTSNGYANQANGIANAYLNIANNDSSKTGVAAKGKNVSFNSMNFESRLEHSDYSRKISDGGLTDNSYGRSLLNDIDLTKDNSTALTDKDSMQKIMSGADNMQLGLKALYMKMDGGEAVSMDEDGFDITDASKEDSVNIIDKIRIDRAIHCDDYVDYGTGVSAEAIESYVGKSGLANLVNERMNSLDINLTDSETEACVDALDTVANMGQMDENAKLYMVRNNLSPSIENINQAIKVSESNTIISDKAGMSNTAIIDKAGMANTAIDRAAMSNTISGGVDSKDSESVNTPNDIHSDITDDIYNQIKNLAYESSANAENNEEYFNNAIFLFNNDIAVNADNLHAMAELDSLNMDEVKKNFLELTDSIIKNAYLGENAKDTVVIGENNIDKVKTAIDVLNKSDINTVAALSDKDSFTISDLKAAILDSGNSVRDIDSEVLANVDNTGNAGILRNTETSINDIAMPDNAALADDKTSQAYKTLLEAKILMSADAGFFLAKNGLDINNTDLSDLNGYLKNYNMLTMQCDSEELETYIETAETVAIVDEAVSTDYLSDWFGDRKNLSLRSIADAYNRAIATYEGVGTEVRTDLGDRLSKAVSNSTESILNELNLDNNKENADAVRILANNQMEMTADNIDKVKELYSGLNRLINNLKPETVLKMIRDNVNPMTDSIDEVNNYLSELNESASEANEEKFSKFLYKLDNNNAITEEERNKFIGIYQITNIYSRDAGKAVGALINQGRDLTMGNLLSAISAARHAGIDSTITDETGMAEVSGTVNYYTNLLSNHGKYVTPSSLLKTEEGRGIDNSSVENFCDEIAANYNSEDEAAADQAYIEKMINELDNNYVSLRMLKSVDEKESIKNFRAAADILAGSKKLAVSTLKTRDEAIELIDDNISENVSEYLDSLSDDINEQLRDALKFNSEIRFEDYDNLRVADRESAILGKLDRQNDFRIPYNTESGVGMMNLTFKSDSADSGKISIKLTDSKIGEIGLELKVTNDSVNIFAQVSDSASAEEENKAAELLEELRTSLTQEEGMGSVTVYSRKTDNVSYITYADSDMNAHSADEGVTVSRLYGLARRVIEIVS